MAKIRTGRFILVMVLWGAILGLLALVLKQALIFHHHHEIAEYVGGGVAGGGIVSGFVILNWLVRHRHFRWLERASDTKPQV